MATNRNRGEPTALPGPALVQRMLEPFTGLARDMRWSYVPPLLVYFAAGVSGLTAIVGTFYVKEELGLSAAFLAGLGFWAGVPWALKMPLGHLVDLIWRWKFLLVYLGAALIATSLGIMYALVAHTATMTSIVDAEAWYVVSVLLAPTGYVIQDVVADAMTVEAVPSVDGAGNAIDETEAKRMHTTMQTLGRIAILTGLVAVAATNISLFAGAEALSTGDKRALYAEVYLIALIIPLVSVVGVSAGAVSIRLRARRLRAQGAQQEWIEATLFHGAEPTKPNWAIFGGSLVFVVFTVTIGLSSVPYAQEIVFAGSLIIVLYLMHRIFGELPPAVRPAMLGTALIVFVFRAVPLPGPGATWFEIDSLGFDQQFLSVLYLISSLLALGGMVLLRPLIATRSIAWVVAALTLAAGLLSLPNIGLYYGVHEWTASVTGGMVDARFIAIADTAMESPLGQIAMIPMLAWIAQNAPARIKATFFAVMASFTNLALSASSLGTRYLNQHFSVTREVRASDTGDVVTAADYGDLGILLVTVAALGLAVPLITILIVQHSPFRTAQ